MTILRVEQIKTDEKHASLSKSVEQQNFPSFLNSKNNRENSNFPNNRFTISTQGHFQTDILFLTIFYFHG